MKKKGPGKEETALLPEFPALSLDEIEVPSTAAALDEALRAILAAGVAGFDTESRPTFRAGDVSAGPHVVQFAIAGRAFIFQLCHEAVRAPLIALLEAPTLLKVGFGLQSDRGQMKARLGVQPASLLDLDSLFRKGGYSGDMGVRAAVGLVLGQRFHKSKHVTTSNWSLPELSAQQLRYAANDAYAALKVYEGLRRCWPNLPGQAQRSSP